MQLAPRRSRSAALPASVNDCRYAVKDNLRNSKGSKDAFHGGALGVPPKEVEYGATRADLLLLHQPLQALFRRVPSRRQDCAPLPPVPVPVCTTPRRGLVREDGVDRARDVLVRIVDDVDGIEEAIMQD